MQAELDGDLATTMATRTESPHRGHVPTMIGGAVDYEDAPAVTLDEIGPTLNLVPDYAAPADAEKVLKKVCDEIFCRELEGWYTDIDVWSKNQSPTVFKQWFDVQHDKVVEDVARGPIENDEGPSLASAAQAAPNEEAAAATLSSATEIATFAMRAGGVKSLKFPLVWPRVCERFATRHRSSWRGLGGPVSRPVRTAECG